VGRFRGKSSAAVSERLPVKLNAGARGSACWIDLPWRKFPNGYKKRLIRGTHTEKLGDSGGIGPERSNIEFVGPEELQGGGGAITCLEDATGSPANAAIAYDAKAITFKVIIFFILF
jgi:hypothetical protein